MDGVEILSLTSIYNTFFPAWVVVIASFLMIVFIMVGMILFSSGRFASAISCCVLSTIMLAIIILGNIGNTNNVHHIEYKVTVDETVMMNEFLEKYEIIDQEGKIYTIKERK